MLAYYTPTDRGVKIVTGESGTFPAGLWVGNHYGLHNLPNDTLTITDGIIGIADSNQTLMRRADFDKVILVSVATENNSGVWRWKTQEELDADNSAELAAIIEQIKRGLIIDRVEQLSKKSVTQLLKKSDWRLS